MRGSCPGSAAEADLSCCVETLSEIERADRAVGRVREIPEALVAAEPLLALGPLVGLLDRPGAARERLAGELERPVALSALGLLEEPDVDIGGEHLVRAAHVARLGQRVLVGVQRRALRGHARRGRDHPIAVRQALAALGGLGAAGGPAHRRASLPGSSTWTSRQDLIDTPASSPEFSGTFTPWPLVASPFSPSPSYSPAPPRRARRRRYSRRPAC